MNTDRSTDTAEINSKGMYLSQSETPILSIVIPVYNEELILEGAIDRLINELNRIKYSYELIISENGSVDKTREILYKMTQKYPQLRCLKIEEPNYGRALKDGILASSGEFVFCDEIDLCITDFYYKSLNLLLSNQCKMVIGSKSVKGSNDNRTLIRKAATFIFNKLLYCFFGFKGTDTHGLKAFHRDTLLPVVKSCALEKDLFTSEFVIRAQRYGAKIIEIPYDLKEMRKTPIHIMKRVPGVVRNLIKLFYILNVKGM